MRLQKRVLILMAILFWALTSWSAPKQPPMYYWPSSPRLASKAQQEWVTFDKVQVKTLSLLVMGSTLEVPYTGPFAFAPKQTQRWNTTFVVSAQPSIRWGIAIFRMRDVLPDCSDESIRGYIRGLHRMRGLTEIESSVDEQLRVRVSIMSQHPKAVSYVINGELKRIEYFFEHQGKLWVFGYEAPVDLFEANLEEVHIAWSRMRQIR